MADDGAPVCNLPNIGQVPALQPGRMFPSLPRATNLPSLLQLVNALAQTVQQLTSPGLQPFKNNLAPITVPGRMLAGTPGINGAAGADGSAASAGKDGKEGKKAKDPNYKESGRKSQKVKVKNPDDDETWLILKRTTKLVMSSNKDGVKNIEWQGNIHDMITQAGTLHNTGVANPAVTDQTGPPRLGTKHFDYDVTEEHGEFPTSGWGEGGPERPFEPGLMADCVGVQWNPGKQFVFVGNNNDGGDSGHWTSVIGISKDGEKWQTIHPAPFGPNTTNGIGLLVGLHIREDGKDYYVVGGWGSSEIAFSESVSGVSTPLLGISRDKGKTWEDLSIPTIPAGIVSIGHGATAPGNYGSCFSIGYDSKDKRIYTSTEYFTGSKEDDKLDFICQLLMGTIDGGFSVVDSQTFSLPGTLPSLGWPHDVQVNDALLTTRVVGSGDRYTGPVYNQVEYVSANFPGQVAEFKKFSATVTGNIDDDISAAVGKDGLTITVSAGGQCSNGGPSTPGSDDFTRLIGSPNSAQSNPTGASVSYN